MRYKTTVFCSLQVEGIHYWEECDIEEVIYLKSPHRHLFHIKAETVVTHSNRDIEFIELKHKIQNFLNERFFDYSLQLCDFENMSCEDIASMILKEFDLQSCEVSEDGENGSRITFK